MQLNVFEETQKKGEQNYLNDCVEQAQHVIIWLELKIACTGGINKGKQTEGNLKPRGMAGITVLLQLINKKIEASREKKKWEVHF